MGNILKITGVYFVGLAAGFMLSSAWRRHRYQLVDCPTAQKREETIEFFTDQGFVFDKKSGAWRPQSE